MKPFPKKPPLKVKQDGTIEFSPAQWDWFIKFKKIKSKSLVVQTRIIKRTVEEAIREGIKNAKS
jgi:hypothetical protein